MTGNGHGRPFLRARAAQLHIFGEPGTNTLRAELLGVVAAEGSPSERERCAGLRGDVPADGQPFSSREPCGANTAMRTLRREHCDANTATRTMRRERRAADDRQTGRTGTAQKGRQQCRQSAVRQLGS